MNFYDCVKKLCKERGMTIETLLNEALGPGSLNVYYGRKRRNIMLKVEDIMCISKVLGVSMDYLCNDQSDEIPKRFKSICDALKDYSDKELKQIEIMIKTLNESRQKK